MTERRADDATRDVEAWLKCFYMRDHLGSVFDGTVSSVTGFGVFVALDDIYVEGLVHVTDLGDDYFHFDAAKHQMLGERSGKRYPPGRPAQGEGDPGGHGKHQDRFRAGGTARGSGSRKNSPEEKNRQEECVVSHG